MQPGAKRNEISGFREGVLYVRVTTVPQKGQANRALLELIAEKLVIPKSSVDIIRGHSSRSKVVVIRGLTGEEVKEMLGQDLSCSAFIHLLRNESDS